MKSKYKTLLEKHPEIADALIATIKDVIRENDVDESDEELFYSELQTLVHGVYAGVATELKNHFSGEDEPCTCVRCEAEWRTFNTMLLRQVSLYCNQNAAIEFREAD